METVPYNMKMRKPKGKVALSLNIQENPSIACFYRNVSGRLPNLQAER
jgi:hypothetical protein